MCNTEESKALKLSKQPNPTRNSVSYTNILISDKAEQSTNDQKMEQKNNKIAERMIRLIMSNSNKQKEDKVIEELEKKEK